MYTYTCIHYIYVQIRTYIHVYTYTYISTYTHIYINIHKPTPSVTIDKGA